MTGFCETRRGSFSLTGCSGCTLLAFGSWIISPFWLLPGFLAALPVLLQQHRLPEKQTLALLRCQRRLAKAHVSCHMLCSRNARRSRRRRKATRWGLLRGEHLRKRALW